MVDNVVTFPNGISTEVPEEAVTEEKVDAVVKLLARIADREFDDAIFIGRQSDGTFYFASTDGNIARVNWDLEKAKLILLTSLAGDEDDYEY